MKTLFVFASVCSSCLWFALFTAGAEPPTSKPGAKTSKPGIQAKADAEPEIPLAIFVTPSKPAEGRDPFFPNSTRPYIQAIKPTKMVAPTNAPVTLTVTGGSPPNLIMIEGRAFAKGEDGDVKTASGKRHIRVLEIHADLSAVIEFVETGERQEIHMRRDI